MPNRIIKESICTSDTIDLLTWFEEVVFYRLMVNCDDHGCFDGRTNVIRGRLFPLKSGITEKQIGDALNKLATVGMVQMYEYDQKPFLHLLTWNAHQQIRAKKRKYPAPPTQPDSNGYQMISSDIHCTRNPIQFESNPNPNPNPIPNARAEEAVLYDPVLARVIDAFSKNIHPCTPTEAQKLAAWLDDTGEDCVLYAIEQAIDSNARNMRYINGILNKLVAENCLTKDAIKARERDRKEAIHATSRRDDQPGKHIGPVDTAQPKYGDDCFEPIEDAFKRILGRQDSMPDLDGQHGG